MAEPTLPAATVRLGALLECLCTAVEEVGPVCYCGPYFGGDTPLDHCEECSGGKCGQAWVRLVQAYPSSSFPNPDADGNCAMPLAYEWEVGVDPLRLSGRRFLNLIYAWLIERTEDPQKLRDQLYTPMPGTSPDQVTPQVIQDEMSAFLSLNRETQRG